MGRSANMKKLVIVSALLAALPAYADRDDIIRMGLNGAQEVPSVNTVASGSFEAKIDPDEQGFSYELRYSGLQGTIAQAHIHFAQKSVNGSIVVWLCQTTGTPAPASVAALTPFCPPSGVVTGHVTAANVIAGSMAPQQFAAGDLASVIRAMRTRLAYANVHTNLSPGGEIRGQARVGRHHGHGHGHDND